MNRAALIALVCVFLAFAATGLVSRAVFERLPHLEDEFAYLYQARIFARGDATITMPQPLRAYWQPFLISKDGQRFGKYTPGWPLVLAVGAGMNLPWITNVWLAMLIVALTYRLGREVFNARTGVVAALLTLISPAALLLNGTLMAHTAALCFVTLTLYAVWRMECGPNALTWGIVGGAALGMTLIIRPLTAVGVAVPLALYGVVYVGWVGVAQVFRRGWQIAIPWGAFGVMALLFSLMWPLFNYTAAAPPGESFPAFLVRFVKGDKDTNLYRTVWDYDRIGFGEGHGRIQGGHTPAAGWRHTKKDLSCAARDLFGWAAPPEDGVTVEQNACLKTSRGYSWVLLPLGALLAIRRRWTWLLLGIPAGIITAHIAYWIGAGVYSARYYYEGLTAAALVSAVGVTRLADLLRAGYLRLRPGARLRRFSPGWIVYGLLAVAIIYSVVIFSPARLAPLRGYGRISQAQIDELNAMRRQPERPLVVIAWGEHHWRDIATLMAVTSPYLDSDIVLARDPDEWNLTRLLDQWPDREVIYFSAGAFRYSLPGE